MTLGVHHYACSTVSVDSVPSYSLPSFCTKLVYTGRPNPTTPFITNQLNNNYLRPIELPQLEAWYLEELRQGPQAESHELSTGRA